MMETINSMLASIKLDSDIIEKYINETLLDSSIPKSEKKEIIKEYLVEPKLEQVANEIIDRFSEGTLKITNNASNDGRAELLTTQTIPKYTRKGLSFSKRSNLERVFSYKGAPSANTNTGNDNPSGYFETPKSKRNNSLLQQGLGKYDDSQTHLSDSSRLAGAGCFGGGVNSVGYEGILKDHIYSEGFVDSTIGTHTEVSRHGVAGGNMLSGITEFGNIGGSNISSMGLAGNFCNDFGGMIGENSGSFAGGSSYPLYSPDNMVTGNTYYGTDYQINNSTISGANIVGGEMFGNMGAVPVDEPDNVTYTDEEIIARVFSTIDEDVIWEAFLTSEFDTMSVLGLLLATADVNQTLLHPSLTTAAAANVAGITSSTSTPNNRSTISSSTHIPGSQAQASQMYHQMYSPNKRMCKFYIRGECYRSDCRFSHDIGSYICRYWLRGACIKDGHCEFLHEWPVALLSSLKSNEKLLSIKKDSSSKLPSPPRLTKEDFPSLSAVSASTSTSASTLTSASSTLPSSQSFPPLTSTTSPKNSIVGIPIGMKSKKKQQNSKKKKTKGTPLPLQLQIQKDSFPNLGSKNNIEALSTNMDTHGPISPTITVASPITLANITATTTTTTTTTTEIPASSSISYDSKKNSSYFYVNKNNADFLHTQFKKKFPSFPSLNPIEAPDNELFAEYYGHVDHAKGVANQRNSLLTKAQNAYLLNDTNTAGSLVLKCLQLNQKACDCYRLACTALYEATKASSAYPMLCVYGLNSAVSIELVKSCIDDLSMPRNGITTTTHLFVITSDSFSSTTTPSIVFYELIEFLETGGYRYRDYSIDNCFGLVGIQI